MSQKPLVYLVGTGLITSIGGDSKSTIAAILGGINRYQDSDFYNKQSKPMKLALVPDEAMPPLKDDLQGAESLSARIKRMISMGGAAMSEALSSFPSDISIPVFVAGPESIPGCTSKIESSFLDQLIQQSEANIDRGSSRLLLTGRAGGLQAIELAFRYFEATGNKYVLVGGIDSYLDLQLLGILDEADRILADGITDGFAPAEGAGFLLLASADVGNNLTNICPTIYMPGVASEEGHRFSEEPYRGDGLANAMSAAISYSEAEIIDSIYSSLNGESFGNKEYGVSLTRNSASFNRDLNVHHPADCYGDIGAATAPVLITLASRKNEQSLVYCSSENEYRSAVCISGKQQVSTS